jgi:CRISPR/Cas system-associated exonuclease Cas4 (RecB family)
VKRYGLEYEFIREVSFDPKTDKLFLELSIGGTADGLLRIWNTEFEQRSLLEVKSQSDERHNDMLKKQVAWPNHLQQAHLYAFRFDVPIIHTFYLNKNNCKREIYPSIFNHAIFDAALLYFAKCNDYVARGELPARQETWLECNSCEYRTMCKPKIVRKPRLATLPNKKLRRP